VHGHKIKADLNLLLGGSIGEEWCQWELENSIKERIEIQKSLTPKFLKWFFEEYVPSSPSEWEKHIGGIFDSYWRIVDNNRETARALSCLGIDKWPDEYTPLKASYDTDFGSVRISSYSRETTKEMKKRKIMSNSQ